MQMMSTKFLPMSCTSPFTVASTRRPLEVCPSTFSIKGSRCATAVFIVSALCKTNGNCICPEPNNSPTTFMPSSRMLLMMSSGGIPCAMAVLRSSVSPSRSASMMRCFKTRSRVQSLRSSFTASTDFTSSNRRSKTLSAFSPSISSS